MIQTRRTHKYGAWGGGVSIFICTFVYVYRTYRNPAKNVLVGSDIPGRAVAQNLGLLSLDFGLRWGIVACDFWGILRMEA